MPVGVILIGRLGGHGESQQNEAGGKDVAGRFQAIGHHGRRVTGDTGETT